jgi:hypothetical protein
MAISDLLGITGISGRDAYNELIFNEKIFGLLGRSGGISRNQSGIR